MTAHFVNLLDDVRRRSLRMASAVEDMVQEACEAAAQCDATLAHRVISRDAEIDTEEVAVESEVIRLMALFQPTGGDIRLLCSVLKINNDLERIADCAVNIAERVRHIEPAQMAGNDGELRQLIPVVLDILRNAVNAYSVSNPEAARQVLTQDDSIDAIYGQFIRKIVARAAATPDHMAAFLDILSIGKNLERIADHATNIGEDVIFLATGKIVRHATDGAE